MSKSTATEDATPATTTEVTLTSPDGRPYVTDDPSEITNLKAAGYAEKSKKS